MTSEYIKTDWQKLAFPRLCALIAIAPTRLSSAMHNAGFENLNIPFTYVAFDVQKTSDALAAMRSLGFRGLSLTIPHKENALELVDELSVEAKEIGAINTVINDGERLFGENTDQSGVTEAFREARVEIAEKRVLILGAGGAAKAALWAMKQQNASSLTVTNRNEERGEKAAKQFGADFLATRELSDISNFDIIINATPIGSKAAKGKASLPSVFSQVESTQVVFDMVTNDTELLQMAKKRGATVIPGIRMLFHQALKQFSLFTERDAPVDVLEKALQDASS